MNSNYLIKIMKIIKILFLTILFTVFAKEISNYIFQSKVESRVYNTGFYYLSQKPLSSSHNFDSLFTPYHIYLLNYRPSPENFVRYFENIRYLSYGIFFLSLYLKQGLIISILLSFILVISPLSLIQKTWISFPDTYTFLFSLFLVIQKLYSSKEIQKDSKELLQNSYILKDIYKSLKIKFKINSYSYFFFFIIISLGLFNHFYQFFFIAFEIICINFYFLRDKYQFILDLLFLLLSAIFIRSISQYLFILNNIEIVDYRLSIVKSLSYEELIKINFTNLFTGIYGFLFGLWLIFLYDVLIKKNYSHIFSFIFSFCITFFTYDTTRIFTLIFFVSFLFSLTLNLRNYTSRDIKALSVLTFLSSIVYFFQPLYYKWGERIIYLK